MSHPLEQLREDALREIEASLDEQALETARIKYLGKSGSVSAWGEQMKTLSQDQKPVVGKLLNEVRNIVAAAVEARTASFRAQKESEALARIDVSLPGALHEIGALHPLTRMWERSIEIFRRMGFALADGPTSRTNGIVSTRSTRRPNIRRETSRTHFICRTAVCCERTLRPCKFERCKPRPRRFA
jgi:phenylalanyl-tRNA synthetase alpha chain